MHINSHLIISLNEAGAAAEGYKDKKLDLLWEIEHCQLKK